MIINTYDDLLKFISDNNMFFHIMSDDYCPTNVECETLFAIIGMHGYYVVGDTVYQYTFES